MATAVDTMNTAQEAVDALRPLLEKQQKAFRANPMPDKNERIRVLQKLKDVILDNKDALIEAVSNDFAGRSPEETMLGELMPIVEDIKYSCKKLGKWMKPSKRHVGQNLQPAKAFVQYQPLGVVGVMVPWNYPLQLAVLPMVGALAAGNRVMVKMSEFTPSVAELFAKLMRENFPEDLITVVNGDAGVAANFSKLPFDHLLFTGSTQVGRIVMRAAAENLTPVTLELGGKSPAIVADDVDIDEAAERLCFGKSFNAGQTCVAPDYVLCPRDKQDAFIEAYRKAFAKMYPTLNGNSDYTSIINERQRQRLQKLVDEARDSGAGIHVIGEDNIDDGSRRMPLHIITDASEDLAVMQDEIFGPVMPVIPYDSLDQAMDYIRERPALWPCTCSAMMPGARSMSWRTPTPVVPASTKPCCTVAVDDMPFGGIGPSRYGALPRHRRLPDLLQGQGRTQEG